jgi:AcrR family transcriptional regulator
MLVNATETPAGPAPTVEDSPVSEALAELVARRPKRADAARNYDKILDAAREAFADSGTAASLEEVARRAEVGIGTLYRNFPNRQALLEAVYVDEVDQMCRDTVELREQDPWEGFEAFARRLVSYLTTKQALAQELLNYVDRGATVFQCCRGSLFAAGEPLLAEAQAAKAVRADTNLSEIIQLLGGIAKIQGVDEAQTEHILAIALDGLRYRPA